MIHWLRLDGLQQLFTTSISLDGNPKVGPKRASGSTALAIRTARQNSSVDGFAAAKASRNPRVQQVSTTRHLQAASRG